LRIVQNSNNLIRVLKSIWLKPGISRIEISKQIGLDRSTVTVVVNRLMSLGFIEEASESLTPYQGGRRPIGLKFCEDIGIILGIEIQTGYFIAVLIGLDGQVYKSFRGEVAGDKNFLYTFLDIYRAAYKEIKETGLPLLGIGIGTSGIINTYKGIITDSNPMGIHDPKSFTEEVKAFIKVPIFIDNDANCGCWGELAHKDSARPQDFLFVLGEFRKARFFKDESRLMAVGMGIVIGEQVHYGRDYSSGEYKSPQWIPSNKTQFSMTDEELSSMKSDEQIFNRTKSELCRDIAFLVNILNLTQVTIGGGLAGYIDEFESCLKEEVRLNWSYEEPVDIKIKSASFKEDTIAFGAASMLLEHLFLIYETSVENPWTEKVGIDLFNSISGMIRKS